MRDFGLFVLSLRETEPYIERANADGAKIKYVLETHFHADFVSGHLDLAKKTGATIVYGPTAQPNFDAYVAKDNEELNPIPKAIPVASANSSFSNYKSNVLTDANARLARKELAFAKIFLNDIPPSFS